MGNSLQRHLRKLRNLLLTAAAFTGLLAAPQANASFIGANAGCVTVGAPWGTDGGAGFYSCGNSSATVSSGGPEFTLQWFGTDEWTVDIQGNTIRISYIDANGPFQFGGVSGDGLVDFSGLNASSLAIGSITYSGITNFDPAGSVALIGEAIRFDLSATPTAQMQWASGSWLEVSFTGGAQAVPEPASIALFGLALAGLGAAGSKRKRG